MNEVEVPSLEDIDRDLARRHLLDFVPWASPQYMSPRHLAPLLNRFERAFHGERMKVVCHAPPRHAKTESVLHVPAWALMQRPEIVFSYSTYADMLSRSKSRKARALVEQVGVELESTNLNEWRTKQGGGMLAGGVGGPLTGHGVNIAIIDDPVKNRIEAESPAVRMRQRDWYNDVLHTRVEPGGSEFCFMTRWHPDDLAGYLIAEHGFEYICLPAIDAAGNALWPERWPLSELSLKQGNAYTWASLYQGQPRPRGSALFRGPETYSALPSTYAEAFGVDLAYSEKVAADWSVVVRMRRSRMGSHATGFRDLYFVTDVVRKQEASPVFKARCAKLRESNVAAPWRWYAYGAEVGVAAHFREGGVPIEAIQGVGDKLARALDMSEAWNEGRVLVPSEAPWLEDFLAEVTGFTGVKDAHDDMVDAAVAAFDLLKAGAHMGSVPPLAPPERTGVGGMDM